MSEYKDLNIYQKLSAITSEINAVAKNLNVGYGKSSYKAVGEADVLAAVKPIEIKYGVYSFPASRDLIESGTIDNESYDYNSGKKVTKHQLFIRVKTIYRFVNTDKPTEFIDITTYGDGVDPQDKAPGKAMTYSDKYGLLKAYKIVTGEDPDQYASGDLKSALSTKQMVDNIRREIIKYSGMGVKEEKILESFGLKSLNDVTADTYSKIMSIFKRYQTRETN